MQDNILIFELGGYESSIGSSLDIKPLIVKNNLNFYKDKEWILSELLKEFDNQGLRNDQNSNGLQTYENACVCFGDF